MIRPLASALHSRSMHWMNRLPDRGLRWWGAAVGLLLGLVDTLSLSALGVRFALNGRPVTPLVIAFFGSSFALLGFLLGDAAEARRRERAAAAAIEATRGRLVQAEKLAALGQLAATIAHEVRNPLGVIRSAAQGLAEALPADADALRASDFIIAEIDRLASVVGGLLELARPLQLELRAVPVHELFDRALLLAGNELAAKRARVRRDEPAELPPLRADPDLVSQVLLGLLVNAVEALPAGGDVRLAARAADGVVELAVEDSGAGIPADLRERIFEPFFTTRARGTGLGLAVARQIVEAHGGRIEARERPGGGARLVVRLPAAGRGAVAA